MTWKAFSVTGNLLLYFGWTLHSEVLFRLPDVIYPPVMSTSSTPRTSSARPVQCHPKLPGSKRYLMKLNRLLHRMTLFFSFGTKTGPEVCVKHQNKLNHVFYDLRASASFVLPVSGWGIPCQSGRGVENLHTHQICEFFRLPLSDVSFIKYEEVVLGPQYPFHSNIYSFNTDHKNSGSLGEGWACSREGDQSHRGGMSAEVYYTFPHFWAYSVVLQVQGKDGTDINTVRSEHQRPFRCPLTYYKEAVTLSLVPFINCWDKTSIL